MNKEKTVEMIVVILIKILVFLALVFLLYTTAFHPYQTNKQVNCYDGHRNLIQNATCHKIVYCSNSMVVKWLNDKECKEFLK